MFWPPSSRSQPKRERSAPPPAQPGTSKPRSPLARAAHKLRKVFSRPHPADTPIASASAPNPPTDRPTTPTTSSKLSEPEIMTPVSSSRSNSTASSPLPPSVAPSSDSLQSDGQVAIPHQSRTSAALERPPGSDQIFDAELACFKSSPRWRKVENLEAMPNTTAWRLFTGEVGSIRASTESSPPTGLVTTEELAVLNTQRRARDHRYSYLKYIGGLTKEQVTKRDLTRRARARRQAYLTLDRALSPKKLVKRELERRARAREYIYLESGRGLTKDEVLQRDLHRQDRARLDAYLTLIGQPR